MYITKLIKYTFSVLLILTITTHANTAMTEYEQSEREKSLELMDKLLDSSKNEKNNLQLESLDIESESSTTTVRIMPLGDSITYDNNSLDGPNPRPVGERHAYRNYLWYKLTNADYNVNFVGSRYTGQDIHPSFDGNNEGWPGITSYDLADRTYGFLELSRPNIVLLHIGTNDHSTSIWGLNDLLDEIDRYESDYSRHVTVVLAKILSSTHAESAAIRYEYNHNLGSLANSRKHDGDDIVVVDMYSGAGINYSTDMVDTSHPNNTGYYKMAKVWFAALENIMSPPVPTKPTNLNMSSISSSSARLSWTDTSSNETGFKIYLDNALVAILGENVTSYTFTGLDSSTTYDCRVKVYNDAGSADSDVITFTTQAPPIPTEPTDIETSNITDTTATLSWNDMSNNETGFRIYNGSTLVETVSANTTSYTLNNLVTRTTYTYTIKAYNSTGESTAATVTFTTEDDYAWLIAVNHNILF